jgi:hypothetical protein
MPPTDDQKTLSGVPPVITLSGIPSGAHGFSGASQQSLSGDPAYGSARPGMTGGASLLDLLQQQQIQQLLAGGDTSAAAGLGLSQPLTLPSFGQNTGGLGAGNIGQGYGTAGQTGTGPGATAGGMLAGQGSGTTADTLALLAKSLGLVKTGVGLASPSAQGAPGTSANPITENAPPGVVAALGQQNAQDLYGGAAGSYTPYAQQTLEQFGLRAFPRASEPGRRRTFRLNERRWRPPGCRRGARSRPGFRPRSRC